ncbi:hypothetical protein C8046_15990 [Serinibacter arcticus]|uniref:Helicase XPB/Ssl2 N-terminal domain-containing protein n=1 Tax=Serinibacter arcticus TaxID=1655435 RepID=A0A2U1ZYA2_9MICO|nr:hypothetical protein C8046_15990 [Serinibacter arcticus]
MTVPAGTAEPAAAVAAAADLPAAARRILDALTWGPPVGTFADDDGAGASSLTSAVATLTERGLVRRTADGGVVLPGATALALREGRTHRDLAVAPPTPAAASVGQETRAAESARAALELHQHLVALVEAWGAAPAGALRSGGVGVREIRRTGTALGAPETTTTLLVELAAAVGEIGQTHDEDGALWAPTHAYDDEDVTARWARLAHAWLHSDRAFALVGTRADDGALRSVLEPGLERGWAARLRRRVLLALTAWPDGGAPTLEAVTRHLAWETPASPPPDWAVAAVLTEAAVLGVTAAGALSGAGTALLGSGGPGRERAEADGSDEAGGSGTVVAASAAALAADLPPAVEEILLQADLTAIVPGRPSRVIEELLARTSEIESRGSGLTARFTTASLSRAVESGLDADEILATLTDVSRTPVPQALEYAVRDAQRRHGGLRAGPAASYLRSDDPGTLTTLVHERDLRLRLLAPTVAVSELPAARLASLLRGQAQAVLVEGPDGVVVRTETTTVAAVPRGSRTTTAPTAELADPEAAVARLREADARAARESDPASAVAALREAVRAQTTVWVTVVGPSGAVDRRRLAPLRVQGGHVVARDVERESDLTIALHRIGGVTPA